MQQVSGWSEQGGTSIVIPGTQGSGTQRFQQSFRGATVTVRDSSNNLATIYSDDLATPTAKANPFTASSTTGAWNFFTTTGTYTLTFSGGSILAPFSITVNVGLGNAGGVPSYAFASLPTSKSQNAGDLARVTDTLGGLWMDSGTQWSKVLPIINLADAPFNTTGDGVANDTTAITTAISAAAAGTIIDGAGKSYSVTQLTINKSLTFRNMTLIMRNPASPNTSQSAFNVTANNVQLIDCSVTITPGSLGNCRNAAGVLATSVSGLKIIRGTYNGSINNSSDYSGGIAYSNIQLNSCVNPKVFQVTAINSALEQIYAVDCTEPEIINCHSSVSGNSAISTGGTCILAKIAWNHVDDTGASGIAINSKDSWCAFNYVKNSGTWGIAVGEGVSDRSLIIGNVVEAAGQNSLADYASILVQQSVDVRIEQNYCRIPKNNIGAGFSTHGIHFSNAPVSFECVDNYIDTTWGDGILVLDSNDVCVGRIERNSIASPWGNGMSITGFQKMSIVNNVITQANRSNNAAGMGIFLDKTATDPLWVEVVGNKILDTTPQQREAIRIAAAYASSVIFRVTGNTVRGWVTRAITFRSCTYISNNNDWDGTARTGLSTLTNGGTGTTVTTGQCRQFDLPQIFITGLAAFTLNPKLAVDLPVLDGSFSYSHTAGTVAGEQITWYIP